MRHRLDEELNVPQPDEPIGLDFEKIVRPVASPKNKSGVLKFALIAAPLLLAGAGTAAALLKDNRAVLKELPIIADFGGPIKERPEQPGGMKVPHQDKLVFGRTGTAREEAEQPNFLAASEQPGDLPKKAPAPLAPTTYHSSVPDGDGVGNTANSGFQPARFAARGTMFQKVEQGNPVIERSAPRAVAKEITAPVETVKAVEPPAPPPIPTPAGKTETETPPAPVIREAALVTATDAVATDADSAPLVTEVEPPKPAAQPERQAAIQPSVKAAGTPNKRGRWMVQIAAVTSHDEAARHWRTKLGMHPAVLGDLDLVIGTTVKNQITYYRVRGGAFKTKTQARKRCRSARLQGLDCIVVRAN